MTLTNRDIRQATLALSQLEGRKLPVRAAFKIGRNLKVLRPIAQDIEEQRQALVDSYAKRDKDGEIIRAENTQGIEVAVFGDNQDDFDSDIAELYDTEVDDIAIQTIDLGRLDAAGVTIEPALLVDSIFTFES